jgi:hypothetical protein
MSQYNLVVQWSGKDALADNNPDKVVSGDDFNTEFLAVKNAVNSKADLTENTQIITAATASAGTNTNQVATTAFVTSGITAATSAASIADVVYPVGSIFTTVTAYANSAAVVAAIGGTTWESFGAGKVLVGLDSGDTDFDTVQETGGSKTQALTEANLPAHYHNWAASEYAGSYDYGTNLINANNTAATSSGVSNSLTTSTVGSGTAHNNLQPYIVVYMWKRTA